MNASDLKNLGLEELNEVEMTEVDGGCFLCTAMDLVTGFFEQLLHSSSSN